MRAWIWVIYIQWARNPVSPPPHILRLTGCAEQLAVLDIDDHIDAAVVCLPQRRRERYHALMHPPVQCTWRCCMRPTRSHPFLPSFQRDPRVWVSLDAPRACCCQAAVLAGSYRRVPQGWALALAHGPLQQLGCMPALPCKYTFMHA